MKKLKFTVLAVLIFVFTAASGASAAMMYSLDGRSLYVNDWEIEAYKQVGWYYGRPVTMHSLDGRTLLIGENEIEAYKQVGWFYGRPVTMHALDGRTLTIGENEIEAYKNVGWFYGRPVTMYSLDGRTLTIGENEVEAYKAVGWYTSAPVTMHSLDGRTIVISANEIEAYKNVGWFYGEPVIMYSLDGRTLRIGANEIEAYEKVGWFYGRPVTLYTIDGNTTVVGENYVYYYLDNGWYTQPVTIVYAPNYSGENFTKELIIPANELEAYKKVGWYATYSEALYVYINGVVNEYVAAGDYESAIYWTQEWEDHLEEPYLSWVRGTGNTLANKWKNKEGCPLVITYTYVTTDDYGDPQANVNYINLSGKTVVAFRIQFDCYNVFGERCYNYNGDSRIKGEITGEWIPDYRDYANIYDASWTYHYSPYYMYDLYEIRNVKFTEIVFSDGTKWSR